MIEDQNTIQEYYKALLERNPAYLGRFYVGVKTTSIFCISTCRARKPKILNTEYFEQIKEAMDYGYRPCKICKPTEKFDQVPEQVKKAIDLIEENPKKKIKDYELRELDLSPEFLRRWFNKNYAMTFHAYQRMFRINNALEEIKKGKSATEVAFDSGYESLSGFAYTYKKMIGKSPRHSKNENLIHLSRLLTPLGPMFIAASDEGLCLLEFVDRPMLETEFKELQKRLDAKIIEGENTHIVQAKLELEEYFDGKRKNFEVALDPQGTDFQKKVWHLLCDIEYGDTCSYQQQSEKLNRPKAIRALASANGYNKIAIIIPCHRVIGKNGKLTGYGGGLERKRWLLEHESRNSPPNPNALF